MFDFIYVIGKGGFGKVWKVQYKKTKEYFALKEMSKRKIIDKKSEKSINSERKFLSFLNHPFIVNMHYAFQDNDNLYLVMDMLSGGDLRYHCSRYRVFSEEQTRFFIACIIYSLQYIHSNNVIHRDIKPENLVLDEKGYVCITDFGIAKENMPDNSCETSGTPGYMSPEVMCGKNHSFQADFFAIGVIGYEFLVGERPYNGKNRKEIKQKMFNEKVTINTDNLKKGWSTEGADFINQLLEKKQDKRLGAKRGVYELKEHQWLKYYPWDELEVKKLPAPFIPEQIDNFDKSYCESEEKITEETKVRYQEIFNSKKYKDAFVDFYYNKDEPKYQRKNMKTKRIVMNSNSKNYNSRTYNEENNTVHYHKNGDIKKSYDFEEKNTKKEILDLGSTVSAKEDGLDNDDKNVSVEKNEEMVNENIQNDIHNFNHNDENKDKNLKEEEKEKCFREQKLNNIQKINININAENKTSNESKKTMNCYNNSKEIQKINKLKKILVNNTNHIKKINEENFLKEYMKYQNEKNLKTNKPKNYYLLKIKKRDSNNNINHHNNNINLASNYNLNRKSSSLISFSPRMTNKNKLEYIGSSKNMETNKVKSFFFNLMGNNTKNNYLLKHYDNRIKFQKSKKKNNSFRINYAKNLNYNINKDTIKQKFKIQSLNSQNENKSIINIHTNNIDRKLIHKKLIGFNLNDEKSTLKKYENNSVNNINSDNFSFINANDIQIKKLFHSNNSKAKINSKIVNNYQSKEMVI